MTATSAVLIYQSYQRSYTAKQLDLSTRYFDAISQLIHSVQKERGLSSNYLGKKTTRAELDSHRSVVDANVEILKNVLTTGVSENIREKTASTLAEHREIRNYIDTQENAIAGESAKRFSALMDKFIGLQVAKAREYSLDGLESRLISQSLFEIGKENAGRVRAFTTGVIAMDVAISLQDLDKITSARAGILNALDSPALNISDKTKRDLVDLRSSTNWKEMIRTLSKIDERASTGKFEEDSRQFLVTMTALIDDIAKSINYETTEITSIVKSVERSASLSYWLFLMLTAVAAGIIIFTAWRITREIVSMLTMVADDLVQSIAVVGESSKQLSDASTSLSTGATEQATSLQETVSSLEEVRSMVGKNAENSKQAQSLAAKSNEEVGKGKSSVEQMLNAVTEIRRSNEAIEQQMNASNQELSEITKIIAEISSKTKVINDIVFQTKLLSFNASVEAARAGEQGKGFAVVAEEIGNLAAMSGNAAKEIVQLLENSTEKVETIVRDTKDRVGSLIANGKMKVDAGGLTAKQCGQALDSIATSSDELTQIVSEVAVASQEQARGVDEIAKAVNQLDEVTHRNSTAANQSASVASELNRQTGVIESFASKLNVVVYGAGGTKNVHAQRGHDKAGDYDDNHHSDSSNFNRAVGS
jgi:methyl-accepting chemotaxis protein